MKLLITGGTGLVGSAINAILNDDKYEKIILSSRECDLTDYNSTYEFFKKIKPDYVIHLAANVGGLFKNMNFASRFSWSIWPMRMLNVSPKRNELPLR